MGALQAYRFGSRAQLNAAVADRMLRTVQDDTRAQGLMLSGGSTPVDAYRALAASRPRAHERLRVLYSDERYVPADHEASNFHLTRPLLEALNMPEDRVLRVRTELPLAQAASDYEERLASLDRQGIRIGLALLGVGTDGHTCSLFSADDLQRADGHLAIDVRRPDGLSAVSVTPQLLATVAEPLILITGTAKREVLAALLAGSESLVASRAIRACERVEVWSEPDAWP